MSVIGRYVAHYKLQVTNKGKGKEKKKERRGRTEEKKKKAMVAFLVFIMATLTTKKRFDGRGQFGGNVFKIQLDIKNTDKKVKFEQSHARICRSTEELKLT